MSCLSPEIFAQCLDAVQAGKSTIDKCIAAHPEVAEELRGLLHTAVAVGPGPQVEPDPQFRSRARSGLLTAIALEHYQTVNKSPLRRLWNVLAGRPNPANPMAAASRPAEMPLPVFLALAILVGAGSAGVSLAAEESLPGEPLYALKSTTEVVRLNLATLAGSKETQAELQLAYASRRLDEMESLRGRGQVSQYQAMAERYSLHVRQAKEISAGQSFSGDVDVLTQRLAARSQSFVQLIASAPPSAKPALDEALSLTQEIKSATVTPAPIVAAKPAAPAPAPTPAPARQQPTPVAPPVVPVVVAATQSLDELSLELGKLPGGEMSGSGSTQELAAVVASAKSAVEQGQPEVAANNLLAFAGNLEEMQKAGRISKETFQALYKPYADAVSKVGAAMASRAPGREVGNEPQPSPAVPTEVPGSASTAATATPVPQPTATVRPSPTPQPVPTTMPSPTPASGDRKPTPKP